MHNPTSLKIITHFHQIGSFRADAALASMLRESSFALQRPRTVDGQVPGVTIRLVGRRACTNPEGVLALIKGRGSSRLQLR